MEFLRKAKYVIIVVIILLIGFGLYSLAGYLVNKNYGDVKLTKDEPVQEAVDTSDEVNDSERGDSLYNFEIEDLGDRSLDVVKTLFSKSPVDVKSISRVSIGDGSNDILTGKIVFEGNIEVYFESTGGIEPYRYYSYSEMPEDLIKYIGCNERYTYTDENGTKEWKLY